MPSESEHSASLVSLKISSQGHPVRGPIRKAQQMDRVAAKIRDRSSARKIRSALGRNRTCDQEIRRLLLYPLSYEGGVGFEAITILQARVKKGFGMAKTKP